MKDFVSELRAKGLSQASAKNALDLLRLILADALDRGHIIHNPCVGVKIPKIAYDHTSPVGAEDSNFSPGYGELVILPGILRI